MLEQFSNHAGTTLSGDITNVATSLTVASATGLPTIPQFRIRVEDELMIVTAVSGTTLTVTRGAESTTGAAHTSGVNVYHVITADALEKARSDSLPIGQVEGRLTLSSGVPITVSDVASSGTVYYTPYVGKRICLYDGTYWRSFYTAEISASLSGSVGDQFDVFAYYDSGSDAVALELTAWTNSTTRATALVRQDGVWCKSGTLTRRYLGTIRLSGTNVSTDTKLKRYCWNCYNRTERPLLVNDTTTGTYTYSSTTPRQVRNTSANKVEMVIGLAEVMVYLKHSHHETSQTNYGVPVISINAVDTIDSDLYGRHGGNTANAAHNVAILFDYPAIGYNYYSWSEKSRDSNATTFQTYIANELKGGLRGHLEG